MAKRIFALEVQPLKEKNYTGIPKVAAAYAQLMLGDSDIEPRFFAEGKWISNSIVEAAITENSGWVFNKLTHLCQRSVMPEDSKKGGSVALFPNYKTCSGMFQKEAFILHDMSVFDLPGFHTEENTKIVREKLLTDCETSDFIFCVSKATENEFIKFDFAKPFKDKVVVAYNGVDMPLSESSGFLDGDFGNKKIISVLGTLEPRKSIEKILEFFAKNPRYMAKYNVRIMGKLGWGSTFENMVETFGIKDLVSKGDIVFEGYVSEHRKDALLKNSALLVYPSIYEGFGLPVAEALIRGVDVLTSDQTSLPEVGGKFVKYYNPKQDGHFEKVFQQLLDSGLNSTPQQAQDRVNWIKNQFSWEKSYQLIKQTMMAA